MRPRLWALGYALLHGVACEDLTLPPDGVYKILSWEGEGILDYSIDAIGGSSECTFNVYALEDDEYEELANGRRFRHYTKLGGERTASLSVDEQLCADDCQCADGRGMNLAISSNNHFFSCELRTSGGFTPERCEEDVNVAGLVFGLIFAFASVFFVLWCLNKFCSCDDHGRTHTVAVVHPAPSSPAPIQNTSQVDDAQEGAAEPSARIVANSVTINLGSAPATPEHQQQDIPQVLPPPAYQPTPPPSGGGKKGFAEKARDVRTQLGLADDTPALEVVTQGETALGIVSGSGPLPARLDTIHSTLMGE